MSDPFGNDFPKGSRRGEKDFPYDGDFNDFFKYIQKMLENFLDSDFSSEFEKAFEGGGDKPFVWGFSFNRGMDGKPRIEKFGNLQSNRQSTNKEEIGIREPLTDIIEEPDQIRVISELPGVEKEDIDLRTTESKMILKAKGESRRVYKKEVKFPSAIFPENGKAKFKNGVLEIVFQRKINSHNSKKIPNK
ncbi:MAG: Small heat shock protein HSP16.5 [Candidatus Heimdallarchaeota archaeon LC_3]|nr:MAG: Small heat shock protein HSP16.5 [Candidatus Heimdallarchaeota archaeon LC_3]